MLIPKIIHQTWKDPTIPEKWRKWQQSWKLCHPEWEYCLWTYEMIDEFIYSRHKSFYGQFKRLPKQIMRLDTFRPFLMMSLGGIYVDLDFECLKPIDALLEGHSCAIGKEPYEHARQLYHVDWLPGSAFMASVPGHPFWAHYIGCIFERAPGAQNPIRATGPAMLKHALDTYPGDGRDITILEPHLLYPMPNLNNKRLILDPCWASKGTTETADDFPGAFAVHRWQASWLSEEYLEPAEQYLGKQPAPRSSSNKSPDPAKKDAELPSVNDIIGRLASIRSHLDYLVMTPDGLGISIRKATQGLFGNNILVFPKHRASPVYSTRELNRITDSIIDLDFNQVILSGHTRCYSEIAIQIKCKRPRLPIKELSHGIISGLENNKVLHRNFETLMTLCQKGVINLIGFNKRGFAETVSKLFNVNAVQYYLYTEEHPFERKADLQKQHLDIGVLANREYRKNVPDQVYAGLLFDNSLVHVMEETDSGHFPKQERIRPHPFVEDPVEFARLLASMDINFYVTFSESWGLVISESLIQGVPCLAGNSSGLFDFSDELKSYLVVNEADNPMSIYKKALKVFENYDELKRLGIEYVRYLNDMAIKSRDRFLSL